MKGRIVKGFKKGDTIVTTVDLATGGIDWKVNGELRLRYNYDRLKD
jgi:hypothetical protein